LLALAWVTIVTIVARIPSGGMYVYESLGLGVALGSFEFRGSNTPSGQPAQALTAGRVEYCNNFGLHTFAAPVLNSTVSFWKTL
jgi:hypothetical protein